MTPRVLEGRPREQRSDARDWYAPSVPVPLDCPGSLMPIPHLMPVDGIYCPVCNRKVYLTVPPPKGLTDPWRGSTLARVQAHWSKPMKESKSGNN
jgi:hypothetical protein